MESLPACTLDPSGKFKYIQIILTDKLNPTVTRTIVRGYASCAFHADILEKTV